MMMKVVVAIFLVLFAAVSGTEDVCSPPPVLETVPNVGYTPGNTVTDFGADPPLSVMVFDQDPEVFQEGTSLEAVVYDAPDCNTAAADANVIALTPGGVLPSTKTEPTEPAFDLAINYTSTILTLTPDLSAPFFADAVANGDTDVKYCVQFQALFCGTLIDFVDVIIRADLPVDETDSPAVSPSTPPPEGGNLPTVSPSIPPPQGGSLLRGVFDFFLSLFRNALDHRPYNHY